MDWIHCNKCCVTGSRGGVYWFTSCGHVICTNCTKLHGQTPGRRSACSVCKKNAGVMEISRSMKPEVLALFKSPKELLADFKLKIRQATSFQERQRHSLIKIQQERINKAIKYARATQKEVINCANRTKDITAEKHRVQSKLEESKKQLRRLSQQVEERNREVQNLQRKIQSRKQHRHSPYHPRTKPSLNGNTPLNSLSFLNCATSTPNEYNLRPQTVRSPLDRLFAASQNAYEESPVAGPAFNTASPFVFTSAASRIDATPKCYF